MEAKNWLERAVSNLRVPPPILCITNDFGPRAGGIETFVIGLIERLEKGRVLVYTSSQDGSQEYDAMWLEKYGVEVIRDRSKILLPTPRVSRAVNRLIRDWGITHIFFGAAAPLGLLARASRRAGAKQIVALTHGHEVWWATLPPFSWAMREIGNQCDHLTYLGEFTRSRISRALSKKSASQMVKVAPGIDVEHFSPRDARALREELGLTQKKVIVSVGRLVHRKGQDQLISSMPQILKNQPDAHLLLVGAGPYLDHLKNLVEENNVGESVTFIGRIQYKDLPTYICVGDIFAMPSRSRLAGLEVEGLGIVYLEASACGLPVIAGNSGGAPDAVIEGETGLVVDGTNPNEIARAATTLLNDPELRTRMGNRGRQWIVDEWRWEIWSDVFRGLLK